eukprot:7484673-Prorocentrum_lima.AAC.1
MASEGARLESSGLLRPGIGASGICNICWSLLKARRRDIHPSTGTDLRFPGRQARPWACCG